MIYFDFALCYNMIFHPDNEEELLYLGDKKKQQKQRTQSLSFPSSRGKKKRDTNAIKHK